MKKRLTILTCLMLVCSFMFGQSSIWGDVDINVSQFAMKGVIDVQIDGVDDDRSTLEVGAFYGNELRGFAKCFYSPITKSNLYQYSVYAENGNTITFKLYDPQSNKEYTCNESLTFVASGTHGDLANPQVINFVTPSVAEVNGVGYQTLAEAYAAATNGEKITLIRDITDATTIVKPTHNIVIDGNGKTVSGGMSFGSDDNKLDNVNINISNVNFVGEGLSVKELANVTVENNTFANITKGNGITVICDNLTETVNVVGNTVTDVVAGTGIRIRNAKEANVNGNTVRNIFSNAILLEGKTYGDVTVTNNLVENWGVAGEGRAIRIVKGANTTVAVNGNAMLHENAPEEFVKVSSNTANVNIDENYWNGENPVEEKLFSDDNKNNVCPANYYKGYETTGTSWSLTNRVDLNYVAKAGDVYYESLAKAYNNAAKGSTINLLCDAQGAGIVINKDVTIDFNGHAYTFSELGVGSGTLTSNGFQILKGNNVTLKNGTLNVAEAMKAKYYILVQNYANLNVENMNLDGTNLDKWSTTDGDSYVLSNNSGNVNIVKTTITANNDGDKAFAFDVCKKASYEAPVVTLDAESTINGRVELSGGQFYPEQGVKVSLTKEIDPYDQENEIGWYTISAPFATKSINIVGDYTLFRYDEGKALWENHKKHNFGIEVGRGYLYANLQGNDLTLEGLANVATYQTTLKCESEVDELKGNHLLGNPYTFDITGEHLVGNIEGGFYQMAGNGAWVASELTEEIAVGEGFLVQAVEETSFAINKTKTAATRSANNGSLQINVANDVYSDVAYVSFNEGVGLSKISHQNANIPMVYVPVENNDYAIAYLGENVEEVPFSFEAKTMGTYTISVKAQNCEFSTMTLVDRFTGVETNLLFEDYSFIAKSSDNSDRFILKLSRGTTDLEEEHFAYINNNGLIINNASGNATLQIFDVMGRPVSSHNVSGNANIAMESLTNGVYILRLIDDNNVRIQKVVID